MRVAMKQSFGREVSELRAGRIKRIHVLPAGGNLGLACTSVHTPTSEVKGSAARNCRFSSVSIYSSIPLRSSPVS